MGHDMKYSFWYMKKLSRQVIQDYGALLFNLTADANDSCKYIPYINSRQSRVPPTGYFNEHRCCGLNERPYFRDNSTREPVSYSFGSLIWALKKLRLSHSLQQHEPQSLSLPHLDHSCGNTAYQCFNILNCRAPG